VTAISTKPVKACGGCVLNLVKKCAVFDYPVLQWKHRTCKGYNDPDLIALYERTQHPEGARARKKERAEKAKLAHTVTHSDGVRKPGGVR
jgi:hypothetical protein